MRVEADLNPFTRTVVWTFTTLDPATLEPTTAVLGGFLPVNDFTQKGTGSVRYSVQPNAGMGSGTTIDNFATIVFDENTPIITNTVTNILDGDAPMATFQALPTVGLGTVIPLVWSGSDGLGSGIAHYNVAVAINDRPFVPLLTNTPLTSFNYKGRNGSRYTFRVTATDLLGQTQMIADTTTTLVTKSRRLTLRQNGSNVEVVAGKRVLHTQDTNSTASLLLRGFDKGRVAYTLDYNFGGLFALPVGSQLVGGLGIKDRLTILGDADFTLTDTQLTTPNGTLALASIEQAILKGGAADNVFDASTFTGRTWLYGDDGNDILRGGLSIDILNGGDGDDTLYGNAGRDRLRGGRGVNVLVPD